MPLLKNINAALYGIIFLLIVGVYLLSPLTPNDSMAHPFLNLILTLSIMASVWINRFSTGHAFMGMALGGVTILASFGFGANHAFGVLVFTTAFYTHAMMLILWRIFHAGTITKNVILGAACVYFLFAVACALIYALIATYTGAAVLSLPLESTTVHSYIYFSIVTLTTLGYGDIVPTTPLAQSIAGVQAILGQLYLTILVARLVGMHLQQKN